VTLARQLCAQVPCHILTIKSKESLDGTVSCQCERALDLPFAFSELSGHRNRAVLLGCSYPGGRMRAHRHSRLCDRPRAASSSVTEILKSESHKVTVNDSENVASGGVAPGPPAVRFHAAGRRGPR